MQTIMIVPTRKETGREMAYLGGGEKKEEGKERRKGGWLWGDTTMAVVAKVRARRGEGERREEGEGEANGPGS